MAAASDDSNEGSTTIGLTFFLLVGALVLLLLTGAFAVLSARNISSSTLYGNNPVVQTAWRYAAAAAGLAIATLLLLVVIVLVYAVSAGRQLFERRTLLLSLSALALVLTVGAGVLAIMSAVNLGNVTRSAELDSAYRYAIVSAVIALAGVVAIVGGMFTLLALRAKRSKAVVAVNKRNTAIVTVPLDTSEAETFPTPEPAPAVPEAETSPVVPEAETFTPEPAPAVPAAETFTPEPAPAVPAAETFTPEPAPAVPEAETFTPEPAPAVPEAETSPAQATITQRLQPTLDYIQEDLNNKAQRLYDQGSQYVTDKVTSTYSSLKPKTTQVQ